MSPINLPAVSRRFLLLALPACFILTPATGQAAKSDWISQGRGAVRKATVKAAPISGKKGGQKPKAKTKHKKQSSPTAGSTAGTYSGGTPAGTGNVLVSGVVISTGTSTGSSGLISGGTDLPIIDGGLTTGGGLMLVNSGSTLTNSGGLVAGNPGLTGSTVLTPAISGTLTTGGVSGPFIVTDYVSNLTAIGGSSSVNSGLTTTLVKNGTGTVILTATNSYSGGTSVNGGTLLVSGTTGTGPVTINPGATLGGTGVIPGLVTNSGTIAPGLGSASSPGTLTALNSAVFTSSSILSYDLLGTDQTIGSGINDLFTGVTNLTLNGTLNISETLGGSFLNVSSGDTWRLIDYSGSLTDNGLNLGTVPALPAGYGFSVDTATTGQVNLVVVNASSGGIGAIPEPSTTVLLALLAAAAAPRRRGKH